MTKEEDDALKEEERELIDKATWGTEEEKKQANKRLTEMREKKGTKEEKPRSKLQLKPKTERKSIKVFSGQITEHLLNNRHISPEAKLHFAHYHLRCTPKSFNDPENPPQCTYSQSKMAKEERKTVRQIQYLDEELLYWGYIEKIYRPGKTSTTVLKGEGQKAVEVEFIEVNGKLTLRILKTRMSPEKKKEHAKHTIKKFKELYEKQEKLYKELGIEE